MSGNKSVPSCKTPESNLVTLKMEAADSSETPEQNLHPVGCGNTEH